MLIHLGLRNFQAFLDPPAPHRVRNMHELGADGAAVYPASLLGDFPIGPQIWM
jgi:hypothetical protein